MDNFDNIIINYIDEFNKKKKPIPVSFKQLIPNLNNSERATHLIHSYPAKLLMHIPYFFLNNSVFSQEHDSVLDSFCGSGTVLLEAMLARKKPIGADSNPLARLISRTKTSVYDVKELMEVSDQIINSIDRKKAGDIPNVVNVDYWFLPHIKKQLSSIIKVINCIEENHLSDFYRTCFSNLVKKVSLADPRVSVPVRIRPEKYSKTHVFHQQYNDLLNELKSLDVIAKFREIVLQNINRFYKLSLLVQDQYKHNLASIDARNLINSNNEIIKSNSIQLFISSPPYCGAQKYIRSSSLCLGWLGFTEDFDGLRNLEKQSIGREHYYSHEYHSLASTGTKKADVLLNKIFKHYPLRGFIAANYLVEMKDSLKEAVRVVKPGGYFVLIAANNKICGHEFKTQEYLTEIVESLGLRPVLKLVDDIKSYGLMTKRNKTASIITCEWILVFQK